jgi:valyl-tRNA synthetase
MDIERVKETTANTAKLLDEYEIGQARHEMDDLFWKDFCDYYIEIVKERLYQPEKHGIEERASGQYACYHALLGILKLYAIYTPHITDYIYQEYYREFEKETSLHLLEWEVSQKFFSEILLFGEELKKIIMGVRKYKSENNLSMKEEMESVMISCNKSLKEYFIRSEKDLIACTNCRSVGYRYI